MKNRPFYTLLVILGLVFVLSGNGGFDPSVIAPGHCLVVYESSAALPREQEAILTSTKWKKDLKWRVLDKDTVFNDPGSLWKKALERPSTTIPRVLIGKYEGELPKDVDAMVTLTEKWK